jgi:AmmeMemoRadiSam system protein B
MKTRHATVAGTFYPSSAREISSLFTRILESEKQKINLNLADKKIIGSVVPHAGYVYSGYEAMHFFQLLKHAPTRYDTFIIINPNHTGNGAAVEADGSEAWETPLGAVTLDIEFINNLGVPISEDAQRYEHSAEVMIPFLQQSLDYSFRIVPVCMLQQSPKMASKLAEKIYTLNKKLGRKLMIIASSDFSHFERPEMGKRKDDVVLERLKDFDIHGLYDAVHAHRISVCGYGPIMTLMEYAQLMADDPKTKILARGNSAKSHPSSTVVDYVTVLFYED